MRPKIARKIASTVACACAASRTHARRLAARPRVATRPSLLYVVSLTLRAIKCVTFGAPSAMICMLVQVRLIAVLVHCASSLRQSHGAMSYEQS
jgi:hypothetical protein